MAKPSKAVPSPVLQSMTKGELSKINRELADLREAADDGSIALANAYKKLKKRGINLEAFKLSEKLNRLASPTKIQSFLLDFDKLRELHGWDDQQNLFEDQKTAPQKAAEKDAEKTVEVGGEKVPRKKLAEHYAKQRGAKAPGKAKKNGNGKAVKSEKTAPAKPKGRAALFSEDAAGDDTPVH